RRISDFLCRALLDSEIYPLAREMENPYSVLPSAIGYKATFALQKGSTFASIGGLFLVLLSVIFGLEGAPIAAIIFGGVATAIFAAKTLKKKNVNTGLGEIAIALRDAHAQLTLVRDEISSGS